MNSNPTGQTQLSVKEDDLTLILNSIEERASSVQFHYRLSLSEQKVIRDNGALVKALRELWDKYTDAVGRGTTEEYYRATVNDESANIAAILTNSSTAPSVP